VYGSPRSRGRQFLIAAALLFAATPVRSQTVYPDRPIKIVNAFSA